MRERKNVRFLTESGVMLSLAIILSFIKIFDAPFGGAVTAGSMIPIIIIALRWGLAKGILVGIVYGLLQSIIDPYIVHPIQFVLDYPVAFGFLGLAGIFSNVVLNRDDKPLDFKGYSIVFTGVLLGILGRFVSHVISGAIFFKEYAGLQNPWIYSMSYNGAYLGIELVITTVIILVIWKPIRDMSFARKDVLK